MIARQAEAPVLEDSPADAELVLRALGGLAPQVQHRIMAAGMARAGIPIHAIAQAGGFADSGTHPVDARSGGA